jgi:hypothetical protein
MAECRGLQSERRWRMEAAGFAGQAEQKKDKH